MDEWLEIMENVLLQALSDMLFGGPAYADAASINPEGVAYVESRGASPQKLRTPGPAGELGKYQMTPPAWKELVRVHPDVYGKMDMFNTFVDENLQKKAMQDYFKILEKQAKYFKLPTDDDALLQMYNVGIGAYKKGTRNQKYVDTYKQGLKEK